MSSVLRFAGYTPRIAENVFLADSARIIGRVTLGDEVSVWFGAVLRGDVGSIVVGARSNVQDLACLHMTDGVSNVRIGTEVTIGHSAIVHGASVADGSLIGMGAILLDNAEIGEECIVGAGALVTSGTRIPKRSLVLGSPAKVVRSLTEAEFQEARAGALGYAKLAEQYR